MKKKIQYFAITILFFFLLYSPLLGQGVLNVSVSEASPGDVDLTAVGTSDWMCWGRAEGEVDNKKDVTTLITMEAIAVSNDPGGESASLLFYDDETGNTFSWSDGTPTESGSGIDGGLWIPSVDNGFRIKVPAGTTPQSLTLYLGVWMADCKLIVSLSDESAPVYEYTNSYTEEAEDGNVRAFVLDFQADADDEELMVEWTVTANHDEAFGGWGNVTLRAAAVASEFLDIEDRQSLIPSNYQLDQNYPNPFNPSTTINFAIPKTDKVSLIIYDLVGRNVKTLINDELASGTHIVTWNGTDDAGNIVPSGVYFYKLQTGTFSETRKMMLLK
jgi:hypothetical protein